MTQYYQCIDTVIERIRKLKTHFNNSNYRCLLFYVLYIPTYNPAMENVSFPVQKT